jgi:GTP-binding protein HflX
MFDGASLRPSPATSTDSWHGDLTSLAQSMRFPQTENESDRVEVDLASEHADSESDRKERVFLVGAALKSEKPSGKGKNTGYGIAESLEELARLADTAGLEVVGQTYQMLEEPNPRTYVGTGKVSEIAQAVSKLNADTVIFDDELSPGQLRNLERALGGNQRRLCDRTALILDIFSQRAATKEGQLQVELAQAEYQLPRLTRMWTHLERQSGSGRVKGMGEKQIEVDRRLLRSRAAKLRREIEEVRVHRAGYRQRRASNDVAVIALVGYTNAGKSTLLNTLTGGNTVLAEDKLFATLDPTTRKVTMPGGQEILLSDTVGFIQKLPTQLVAAFRATLEEIKEASILLHVVDASHPCAAAQVDAVRGVLKDIGAHNIPSITVWNKVDACWDPEMVKAVAEQRDNTVCVSAMTGDGIPDLLTTVGERLRDQLHSKVKELLVPYTHGDLVEEVHRCGVVERVEYTEHGCLVTAAVPAGLSARLLEVSTVLDPDNGANGS